MELIFIDLSKISVFKEETLLEQDQEEKAYSERLLKINFPQS
jgi:hypothetical protein